MKRLILSLIVAVIATTIGAGWIISQFHSRIKNGANEIDVPLNIYKQLGEGIALTLDDFPQRDEFIMHWKIRSNIDIFLQDQSDFSIPTDINQEFEKGIPLLLESEGEMSIHIYMENSGQVKTMLLPIQNEKNHQFWLNMTLTLFFYFVVVVVLLAWLYPLIRRLIMLQKAANQFGRGDLSSRIIPNKISYISDIENEFNRMARHIEKLIGDNKLLSRAVSHNLKTPVTRLRMGIDVLEEATGKTARDGYIKRINNDLDEMQSLIETLLQYSSLDEFNLNLKNENIDLKDYIPDLIKRIDTTDITITTFISTTSAIISTDPRYLAMQLDNIMSNALQHAISVVVVRVGLHNNNQEPTIYITIEDDGAGISEAERIHVTKPFWRGKNDPAIKGHGMGLAIVARIADWLKAELVITRSESLGGASISLFFKKK